MRDAHASRYEVCRDKSHELGLPLHKAQPFCRCVTNEAKKRGAERVYGSYDDAARLEGEDRQYDDAYYAAMRARRDTAQPTYPGGPLPGDEDAVDADLEYGTGYRGAER